jgi:hypothetical protein
MCSCSSAHSPRPGHFPPEQHQAREQWFAQVLKKSASLKCASSKGKCNPRMVKRRHSPYASHDRSRQLNQAADFTPTQLKPLPLSKRGMMLRNRVRRREVKKP